MSLFLNTNFTLYKKNKMANVKISELPLGTPNNNSIFPFVDAGTTYQGAISAITSTGGGVIETDYSTLQDMVNGGGLTTNWKGYLYKYDNVWYDDHAVTNILSLHNIHKHEYKIQYNNFIENAFL